MRGRSYPQNAERWIFGLCYPFALALHERTGWPMRGLGAVRSRHRGEQLAHLWVIRPDGIPLDAGGVLDEAEACEYFLEGEDPHTVETAHLIDFSDQEEFLSYVKEQEGRHFQHAQNFLEDAIPRAKEALEEFATGHLAGLLEAEAQTAYEM